MLSVGASALRANPHARGALLRRALTSLEKWVFDARSSERVYCKEHGIPSA